MCNSSFCLFRRGRCCICQLIFLLSSCLLLLFHNVWWIVIMDEEVRIKLVLRNVCSWQGFASATFNSSYCNLTTCTCIETSKSRDNAKTRSKHTKFCTKQIAFIILQNTSTEYATGHQAPICCSQVLLKIVSEITTTVLKQPVLSTKSTSKYKIHWQD